MTAAVQEGDRIRITSRQSFCILKGIKLVLIGSRLKENKPPNIERETIRELKWYTSKYLFNTKGDRHGRIKRKHRCIELFCKL
jgi:hypothetical protein